MSELSNPISAANGVREGCILSPLLFIVNIDDVLYRPNRRYNGVCLTILATNYADDVCLLSRTFDNMADILTDFDPFARDAALEINCRKRVKMRVNPVAERSLQIGEEVKTQVYNFCYLASVVDRDGGASDSTPPD